MNIYQHFREDEQAFIDQVIDWIAQVENQYAPHLTSFLNPRQQFIAQTVIAQYDSIEYKIYGGYEGAEQQRVLMYPPYFEPEITDFDLTLLEVNYPTKFAELSHGQIMGSILGAGIMRRNLGDIITDGSRWQFFLDTTMKEYVLMNVDQVGKVNIHLEEKPLTERIKIADKWETEEIVVSSMRIDVILARALNFSRNRAKKMIDSQKIKINWVEIDRPDIELEEYDIISVRGFGRIKIGSHLGTTRKDNLVIGISFINRNN